MTIPTDPVDLLIRKMGTRHPMDAEDIAAIRQSPVVLREVPPGTILIRERQQPTRCSFIVAGFAFRQKLTTNGGRQIVGVLIPGDFSDLQQLWLARADHNVQALTRMTLADISIEALRTLALARPAITQALWIDALIEASRTRELVLNIGRRDAMARIAHLLCEFELRLRAMGLADAGYDLPMTQEQLGDATALTSVHVNRTLKLLERDGLIERHGRHVRIAHWDALAARADFDPLYLHHDQVEAA